MIWLILGVLLWDYSHLMKRITPDLRATLGDVPGKLVVTALSFVSVYLMVTGYRSAPVVQLWSPPVAMVYLNNALMLVAVVLVNLGFSRGVMRTWMRHPMLSAVIVWAVAHLSGNGDLASVILFGGVGLWAIVDLLAINRMEPAWVRPAAGPARNDLTYLAASLAVYAVIVAIHSYLGYPPFG